MDVQPLLAEPMPLGVELRRLRMERGFGLTEAAGRAGVSKAALSQWESGARTPFGPSLDRLLSAIDAPYRVHARLIESTDPIHARIALVHNPLGAPVNLGQTLRAMRLRSGLTQSEVARHVQVSQGIVARWESGENFPSTEALHAVLFLFRASDEEVLYVLSSPWTDPLPDVLPSLRERLSGMIGTEGGFSLMEVTSGLVQRDAWRQATKFPEADAVLSEVTVWRSSWFLDNARIDEAKTSARQAIRLAKANDDWNTAAYGAALLAHCLSWGAAKAERRQVAARLGEWLERPLSKYWRGVLLCYGGSLWGYGLKDWKVSREWGLRAMEELRDTPSQTYRFPYTGFETAVDLVAVSELELGYPERAVQLLKPFLEGEMRKERSWMMASYLYALKELEEPLPAEGLRLLSEAKLRFDGLQSSVLEFERFERHLSAYARRKGTI